MKNIIIVGAGGLGKELYYYLINDLNKANYTNFVFKGFLDDSIENFQKTSIAGEYYLGKIKEYAVSSNDYIIVGIGSVLTRNYFINYFQEKKANFFTFIHSSSIIQDTSIIGEGVIICPYCIIQPNSNIGSYSILNVYVNIGHDSKIGQCSILSPYATLNGNVVIGDNLFMATRSSILAGSSLGNNCIISAHTVVKGDFTDNYMFKDQTKQIKIKNRLNS